MKGDKRGISAIVATVLIILITVAGITIIWTAIIPMIKNGANFDDPSVRLEIDTTGGYTFWDSDDKILYVQVSRGSDDAEIVGFEIIITTGGNSDVFEVVDAKDIPAPNEKRIIKIPNIEVQPDSVEVVPVLMKDSVKSRGVASASRVVGDGKASDGLKDKDDTHSGPGTTTPTAVCDSSHLNLCDSSNCEGAGGYWYEGSCKAEPDPTTGCDGKDDGATCFNDGTCEGGVCLSNTELVVCGDFSCVDDWNLDSSWQIDENTHQLKFITTPSDGSQNGLATQNLGVTVGNKYHFSFNLVEIEENAIVTIYNKEDSLDFEFRESSNPKIYEQDFNAAEGEILTFNATFSGGGGSFIADDVSVREILESA